MSDWLLAEINIAEAKYDLDDPAMDGFTSRIEEINALAEEAPGFAWRLVFDDALNAEVVEMTGNPRIVLNMSMWTSFDTLSDYIFKSDHLQLMRDRHQWFKTSREATLCFWWMPAAAPPPTMRDGWERLMLLRDKGPTPAAFPMKRRYPPPSSQPSFPANQGLATESLAG
jgi:hypothetical protein